MQSTAQTSGGNDLLKSSTGVARLPGLDGLRAVSITLVLFCHIVTMTGLSESNYLRIAASYGRFGVQIFFVLSGFIITWLLLQEETRKGSIDIRQFYIRRAFRILPPAFVYLGFIALLVIIHRSAANWREIAFAAGFCRNLYPGGVADTGHFWTLAIEEQFYLAFPLLLKLKVPRLRFILLALIALSVFQREYYRLFPNAAINITAFQYGPLLIGCALAICRQAPRSARMLSSGLFRSTWTLLACVAVILALFFPISRHPASRISILLPLVQYTSVALIINYLVEGRQSAVNAVLNSRPVVCLGQLSYSLYLWQQPFCFKGAALACPAPLSLVASIVAATLSYFVVEQPALRLRQRLTRGSRVKVHPAHPAKFHPLLAAETAEVMAAQ